MSETTNEQNLLQAIREALVREEVAQPGTAVVVTAVNETIGVNIEGVTITV